MNNKDKYSKHNPKNKMEAWYYQLNDDLKLLRTIASSENREDYNKHCDTIILKLKQAKQP